MAENLREHIRINLNCTVFVELAAAGAPGAGEGGAEIALCKTLDVSYGGLKVSLARELAEGSLLQIGVELPGLEDTLYLTGEVKWCRPSGDRDARTAWAVGFELLNSDDTDIDKWRDLLEHV